MKRVCAILVVMAMVGAIPAASARPAANQIERNIRQAIQVTFSNPVESLRLLETSFRQSLDLTRPQFSLATRELGFALACKCLHPSLFPEVRVAINTYLSLFPKGAHRKAVLVQKAILDYAEGGSDDAENALTDAAPLFSGREKEKVKNFQLNGFMADRKFASAGDFLKTWNETEGTTQSKRNVRRWERGAKAVQDALDNASTGDVDGLAASRYLQEALELGYFTEKAPNAAMGVINAQDRISPQIHGQEINWMGKSRTVFHYLPAFRRHEKLVRLLQEFPEAAPEFRGNLLVALWLVLKYELNRPSEAERYLARLSEIPAFEGVAELEKLVAEIDDSSLVTEEGHKLFQRLEGLASLLPYDNGVLPVIDKDLATELRVLSELLSGNSNVLNQLIEKYPITGTFRTIPLRIIYLIAGNQKLKAYQEFNLGMSKMSSRDRRLAKDYLFPLYSPPTPSDWKLLGAFAAVERFPILAIDKLIEVLTLPPDQRPLLLDHAIALLADLFQNNQAYIEAQSVWTTLRTLYPSSVWVR